MWVFLTIVFLCFGAYIYLVFQQFLVHSLQQTLLRRAQQIAVTILDELPARGEPYVASEIQARYAPELNERVIRITDANHREIYASTNAHFLATSPSPPVSDELTAEKPVYRELSFADGSSFRIVGLAHRLSNGNVYTVEVGAPETNIANALHNLVVTLVIGFPVLIGLAILGGYSLLGRGPSSGG